MRRMVATAILMVGLCGLPGSSVADQWAPATPPVYVADFVSTAADGIDMNDGGDVTGTSYPDPGCGPFCLPPLDTVVWRAGERIVLSALPGFSGITVRSINAQGWVAGYAGMIGTTTRVSAGRDDPTPMECFSPPGGPRAAVATDPPRTARLSGAGHPEEEKA